jgi:hypothetical protein
MLIAFSINKCVQGNKHLFRGYTRSWQKI